MGEHAKQNAFYTGIAAAIMLFYGFGMNGITVIPAGMGPFYEFTITAFNWMLKIGGLGMAAVAIVCMMGLPIGLLLDFFASGVCGFLMVACALFWTIQQRSIDLQDLFFVIFGAMYVRSAFVSLSIYRKGTANGAEGVVMEVAAPKAEPIHPASIRPSSLATDEEPPEGYLAALSREKDEPPTGAYK